MFQPLNKIFALAVIIFEFLCCHVNAGHFVLAATINDSETQVTCLSVSPSRESLITGDAGGNLTFRDPKSGKAGHVIKAFKAPVECISYNSTGKLMIAASRDGEINIYNLLKKKLIHSLYSPEYGGLNFALFSIADGFIYFNGRSRLYKVRSDLAPAPVRILEYDSILTCALMTEDRSALIFSSGHTIYNLNTRTDQVIQEINTSGGTVKQMTLLVNRLVTWNNDGTIAVRHFGLNQLSAEPVSWFKAGSTGKFAFSGSGNLMVTGNTGTWIRIWNLAEKKIVQELFGHQGSVTDFVFSDDDRSLFTVSTDKTIRIWIPEEDTLNSFSDNSVVTPETIVHKPDSIKAPDSVPHPESDKMPSIELDRNNIPVVVGNRKVDKTTVVEIDQSSLDIYVYDNSTLDGDIISLTFHNQWILTHYPVTKKKKKITLQLKPDSNNYLVLFADNLGKTPPNTAVISFVVDNREKIFRLESDLKSCSAINLLYKKK